MEKTFLKQLGLILILLGALILVICFFCGFVNQNWITISSLALMIIGLVTYIILNKILDK